jgi:EAL domain-containing protein (putative c-di-GMP-specific phosphodiesterase class I)
MEDIDATQRIVARLKRSGFSAAIDDFGTGYSSLAYLQRLNADCLKIDRSFIVRAERSEQSQHIVRSVIDMSRGLGLRTIAEGIETKRQLEFLRDAGCHEGQGNIFAAPMASAACGLFLAERAPPSARVGGARRRARRTAS